MIEHPVIKMRRCRFHLPLLSLLALPLLIGLTSCAGGGQRKMTGETLYIEGVKPPPRAPGTYLVPQSTDSWWKGEGVSGTPRVQISLREQKAYFYKNNELVGVASISSGDESHGTPTGVFSISQKSPDHRSSQYGDYVDGQGNVIRENVDRHRDPMPRGARFEGASMPYFMRFNRGIGMHAGYLPGYPASHGCVRLPQDLAEAFFRHAPVGTTVIVKH